MFNSAKTILSLYDYSGNWSKPYRDNGYNVVQIDILLDGKDARLLKKFDYEIYGILAACPCTKLSNAGAHIKRTDEEIIEALSMIDCVFRYAYIYNPKFWVIENPPGKLKDFLGTPQYKFQPYWFGSEHSKLTYLWGKFNPPKPTINTYNKNYKTNYIEKLGSNNVNKRSETPIPFAYHFYNANK